MAARKTALRILPHGFDRPEGNTQVALPRDNLRDHSLGWPYRIDVRVLIGGSVVGCAVRQGEDAGEQLDAADEVGALRDRLAPPSQLIQVLGGPKAARKGAGATRQ